MINSSSVTVITSDESHTIAGQVFTILDLDHDVTELDATRSRQNGDPCYESSELTGSRFTT